MTAVKPPLNGLKTHPLTEGALNVLRSIAARPIPWQEINPGHRDRFLRGDLVEVVKLPSPYKSHKGGLCDHAQITDAGRSALQEASHD